MLHFSRHRHAGRGVRRMHVCLGARPAIGPHVRRRRFLHRHLKIPLDLDARGCPGRVVATPVGAGHAIAHLQRHDALLALGQHGNGVHGLWAASARGVIACVLELEAARFGAAPPPPPIPTTSLSVVVVVCAAAEQVREGSGAGEKGVDDGAEEFPEHGEVGGDDGDEGFADGPGAGELGAVDGVLYSS